MDRGIVTRGGLLRRLGPSTNLKGELILARESVLSSIGLTIVAALHLMAVYVAMMGPLVCLWLQWRARRDQLAADLERYLLRLAVLALLAAAVLGGVSILFIGRLFPDAYLAAARVLPRSRFWPYGVVELVFSFVCFVTAAAWSDNLASSPGRRAVRSFLALLGSSNLVYHFPALFVMLGVLCTRTTAWGQKMKFTALLGDPEIVARITHHLLAALTVTGMAMVWYSVRRGAEASRAVGWGSRIAVLALIGQLFTGLWLLMVLPAASRQALSGGDAIAACLFAVSLLVAFFVLPRLTSAAFGQVEYRPMVHNILLIFTIVLLMTAMRHRTRALLLATNDSPAGQHGH